MFRKIYNASFLVYPALLVLAIIFYKERMIFTDAAYYLFQIISTRHLKIQHFRFGAAFTEIFPVMGMKLDLPLNSLLLLYSGGFIIYYFLCYLLCGTVFRDYKAGLVLLFANVLFTSHTFYWMLSELLQGICFYITVVSFLNSRPEDKANVLLWIWMSICACFIVFFHPMMVFIISYTVFFFHLEKQNSFNKKLLWYLTALCVLVFVIKAIFFREHYEYNSMSSAGKLLKTFPHYFDIYSNKQFLLNCLKLYYGIPVSFAFIAVVCIRLKKWGVLLLSGVYVFGYLLLVNVSFPTDSVPAFYTENLYLPIGLFLAFPLVYVVFPAIGPRYAAILTAIASLLLIARILYLSPIYSDRLQTEREILKKYPDQKIVLKPTKETVDRLILTWGTPYECWLLSTTENGHTASVILKEDPADLQWTKSQNRCFADQWGCTGYKELPARYFIFKDTASTYHIINE